MTSLRELLSFNMRERRRILGLSQVKLAEKMNTAPTYIAMVELQKRFPSVEMLERIAAALEIDAPQLFSVDGFPSDSIKNLHKSVLSDIESAIENVISKKIEELEKS